MRNISIYRLRLANQKGGLLLISKLEFRVVSRDGKKSFSHGQARRYLSKP